MPTSLVMIAGFVFLGLIWYLIQRSHRPPTTRLQDKFSKLPPPPK